MNNQIRLKISIVGNTFHHQKMPSSIQSLNSIVVVNWMQFRLKVSMNHNIKLFSWIFSPKAAIRSEISCLSARVRLFRNPIFYAVTVRNNEVLWSFWNILDLLVPTEKKIFKDLGTNRKRIMIWVLRKTF